MSQTSLANVAIIIAVSDYKGTNDLPACKHDGEIIGEIIRQTGRFAPENIFFEDTYTDGPVLRNNLAKFIDAKAKGLSPVQEVFFYYTGHGMYDGQDFSMLFGDYNPSRTNRATLPNSELDGMLRSLKPSLAVKVVDACHSGTQYIKADGDFEKTIRASSEGRFNNCCFMFSSEQHQKSWQDANLSYFTRAFIRSLLDTTVDPIRYREIAAYIADQFAGNSRQRPFFIMQGSYADAFTSRSPTLVSFLNGKSSLLLTKDGADMSDSNQKPGDDNSTTPTGTVGTTTTTTTKPPASSLADRLEKKLLEEAANYCKDESEANSSFEELRALITAWQYPSLLSRFFSIAPTFMKDTYSIPNALSVAKWLEENKGDYFVSFDHDKEEYEPTFPTFSVFGPKKQYRYVLRSFDTSVKKPPFRAVHLVASPRLPNLPQWMCYIALVHSRVEMRGFYSFVKFIDKNWTERTQIGEVEWKMDTFYLKDKAGIKAFLEKIVGGFTNAVEKDLLQGRELGD